MLCEACYDLVVHDRLPDEKNFVADSDRLFDTICVGCTDINRPLIDDMAGSGE
jgi:hypothetical protein